MHLNVTALLALEQVRTIAASLVWECPEGGGCRSLPVESPTLAATRFRSWRRAVEILGPPIPSLEPLGASPVEILNVRQAESIGCHIITVTPTLMAKISWADSTGASRRCRSIR